MNNINQAKYPIGFKEYSLLTAWLLSPEDWVHWLEDHADDLDDVSEILLELITHYSAFLPISLSCMEDTPYADVLVNGHLTLDSKHVNILSIIPGNFNFPQLTELENKFNNILKLSSLPFYLRIRLSTMRQIRENIVNEAFNDIPNIISENWDRFLYINRFFLWSIWNGLEDQYVKYKIFLKQEKSELNKLLLTLLLPQRTIHINSISKVFLEVGKEKFYSEIYPIILGIASVPSVIKFELWKEHYKFPCLAQIISKYVSNCSDNEIISLRILVNKFGLNFVDQNNAVFDDRIANVVYKQAQKPHRKLSKKKQTQKSIYRIKTEVTYTDLHVDKIGDIDDLILKLLFLSSRDLLQKGLPLQYIETITVVPKKINQALIESLYPLPVKQVKKVRKITKQYFQHIIDGKITPSYRSIKKLENIMGQRFLLRNFIIIGAHMIKEGHPTLYSEFCDTYIQFLNNDPLLSVLWLFRTTTDDSTYLALILNNAEIYDTVHLPNISLQRGNLKRILDLLHESYHALNDLERTAIFIYMLRHAKDIPDISKALFGIDPILTLKIFYILYNTIPEDHTDIRNNPFIYSWIGRTCMVKMMWSDKDDD